MLYQHLILYCSLNRFHVAMSRRGCQTSGRKK